MVRDSGMTMATEAELNFIWKVINKFAIKFQLNRNTFMSWGESMQGMSPKSLMYYGQYLDTKDSIMKLSWTDSDGKMRRERQFFNAMTGKDGQSVQRIVPDCIKLLVSECLSVGESMVH
jgi:hypothetical protein